MQSITVNNCENCPLFFSDNLGNYCGGGLPLPSKGFDKTLVPAGCPLRDKSIFISLENENNRLPKEEVIEVNQQMITEWMQEAKEENYLAFYMACLDTSNNIRMFRSSGMSSAMLIRHFRFISEYLRENPFEADKP